MLFASGIALLLLVYQVLSAMGSWVVDFLLFDRAAARYSGDELTEFLSVYTALLNLVDILFLALLAGPLMRRFGLRLGLLLNPAVVACVLAVMLVVAAGAGTAAFGVFILAGVLRIADIATTDGTTRTSINAAYQVVPVQERLAVQAVVEGIGVPVAIGVTGVVLLALNVLGLGIGAVIAFGLVLGVVWTAVAVSVYRSYTRSLADEMRRRSLSSLELDVAEDDAGAVRALLRSDDARDVRLGLDLLAGVSSPAPDFELRQIAEHADPEVRMRALALLAAHGDERASADVAVIVRDLAASDDAVERRAAAAASRLVESRISTRECWLISSWITNWPCAPRRWTRSPCRCCGSRARAAGRLRPRRATSRRSCKLGGTTARASGGAVPRCGARRGRRSEARVARPGGRHGGDRARDRRGRTGAP